VETRLLFVATALTAACSGVVSADHIPRGSRGSADAPLVLDGATTILVGADEPGPVVKAAQDLAADFEKVFGRKPALVQRAEDTSASVVVIGYATSPPARRTICW
jgi:hypothetical protein